MEKGWEQQEFPWEVVLALGSCPACSSKHISSPSQPHLSCLAWGSCAAPLSCSPGPASPCYAMPSDILFRLFQRSRKKRQHNAFQMPSRPTLPIPIFHLQPWSPLSAPLSAWADPEPPLHRPHSQAGAPARRLWLTRHTPRPLKRRRDEIIQSSSKTNILTALANIFHRFLKLH